MSEIRYINYEPTSVNVKVGDPNNSCNQVSRFLPAKLDTLIIPSIFAEAVFSHQPKKLFRLFATHKELTKKIVGFYYNNLFYTYYYKKNSLTPSPRPIPWACNDTGLKFLFPSEMSQLYQWMTQVGRKYSYYAYMLFQVNQFFIQLRAALQLINQKLPANFYYNLGENIKTNEQMKVFIMEYLYYKLP